MSAVLIHVLHTLYMPRTYFLSQMNCEISVEADWGRLTGLARKLARLEGAGGETEDIAQEALLLLLHHPIGGRAVRPEPYLAAVIRRLVAGQKRSETRRSRREAEFVRHAAQTAGSSGFEAEIRLFLGSLSASERHLTELLLEGWTVREIASRLRSSRSGTHRRIVVVRERLSA